MGFIYGGVNHVLHLPQGLPHHVDVGDLQEVQLDVRVEALTFKPSVLCLHASEASEVVEEARAEGLKREMN